MNKRGVTNQDDAGEEQDRYTSDMNRDIHLKFSSVGGPSTESEVVGFPLLRTHTGLLW
jgi:type IV secretory pathway VirD2 relaxase